MSYPSPYARRRTGGSNCLNNCLLFLILLVVGSILVGAVYFFAPFPTRLFILGIDYSKPSNWVARSDTIILATFRPLDPYVGLYSIPRDLWVNIPGVGENRINTAHFYAEAEAPGSGPTAVADALAANFEIKIHYYLRFRFQSVEDIVDAMGGLDIVLEEARAGYAPGAYHLTGKKALAFARQRLGSDDFFRMENGQFIIKSALRQLMQPAEWVRLPQVLKTALASVDTNLPFWLWPRLGLTLLRVGADKIDSHTITRKMVTPFTTSGGANVLLPDWSLILPEIRAFFRE